MSTPAIPPLQLAIIRAASALDDGTAAVIGTDTSGTVLYWNEVAESLYGRSTRQALDSNIVDMMRGQQTTGEAEAIMHQLLAGKTWSGTFLVRHHDGNSIRVHVTDVPVLVDGKVVGVVGVSRSA
jgi:PAS domain S-box-containing protein